MKKKNKSLVKNIGLFTIGSFGSKIISFLMVPLYTAVLSTSEYGTVDLMMSTVQLLIPILLLSIQDAILRFGMDDNFEKEDVISTSFNIILKAILFLFVGIIILKLFNFLNLSNDYLIFLFFSFVLNAINNCMNVYLKSKNKASIIVVSGILCTFITCLSNIILLLVFKMGVNGFMISNTIGIFIQVTYQLLVGKSYKDIHLLNYNNISKPKLNYSIPLISNSVAWWVNNVSDRYILTWIKGISANGIYSVAYKIPTILTTFQSVFFNAWSISAIAEFDSEDKDGFIGENYTIYSFVSLGICSFLLLFNIPIASVLYSGKYFTAWKCVPFLLVGTVFNGIAQFEGSLYAAVKETKIVSLTTIIGSLINTVCNFLFIFLFGAIGAALSTTIGYCITWGLRTFFLQRFIRMKVYWKKHILAVSFLIAQSFLTIFNDFYMIQLVLFVFVILFSIPSKTLKKILGRLNIKI